MSAVVHHVGVVARAVGGPQLQEAPQLALHGLQAQPSGGVVAAEVLDHVVGEEELHLVQHARGALVQLLHLVRWQQHGLAVEAGGWGLGGGDSELEEEAEAGLNSLLVTRFLFLFYFF